MKKLRLRIVGEYDGLIFLEDKEKREYVVESQLLQWAKNQQGEFHDGSTVPSKGRDKNISESIRRRKGAAAARARAYKEKYTEKESDR